MHPDMLQWLAMVQVEHMPFFLLPWRRDKGDVAEGVAMQTVASARGAGEGSVQGVGRPEPSAPGILPVVVRSPDTTGRREALSRFLEHDVVCVQVPGLICVKRHLYNTIFSTRTL